LPTISSPKNGAWSEELLANHFIELSALDLNFSPDVTGFEIGEIDLLIEGQGKAQSIEHDAADDVPNIAAGPLCASRAIFGC
jgi:hypothetical protein